jgi:hypothetical protein
LRIRDHVTSEPSCKFVTSLIASAKARLMFSREPRAFLRSGDPRPLRTSPSDTAQNNAASSLSLRCRSSWFEISFLS